MSLYLINQFQKKKNEGKIRNGDHENDTYQLNDKNIYSSFQDVP